MLNMELKRKIDSLRSILVGKVPDPKAQVEQITFAWIYKYMSDLDRVSEEIGGKPQFFNNGYQKYAWNKLFDHQISGQDRLNLYSEALYKMSENPYIPQLFKDIFKDAVLPYRNPETLNMFLKEVNDFNFEHTEELGDAYEYLLSILGSQGDAGQFRTPRHIIDFIVAVVDPKKDETICDPACGTAGFLISAYKHIIKQHDGVDDSENKEKPLTPDERKKLMEHFSGYDISPDMVRLSKVNLYLHGFQEPTIFEYDTLSDEEKWDESFDVMLANPPFMSPKGGIKPHKRFSVQANRSEVLFVDYIMEHLRPHGRAGIIVPEGIIFQSGLAYKQLRKNLVEDGLFAVVSLPSGVFNPYAGVKTSILLFDNEIAKKKTELLFVKIENDGFNLGAQRREITGSDLPQALDILKKWKENEKTDHKLALYVDKSKIAENGDYNLSGDRFHVATELHNTKWPISKILNVAELVKERADTNEFPYLEIGDIDISTKDYSFKEKKSVVGSLRVKKNNVIISKVRPTRGAISIIKENNLVVSGGFSVLNSNIEKINPKYLFSILANNHNFFTYLGSRSKGATYPTCSDQDVLDFEIPLPPLDIQKQIVAELDGYQNIISGAKQIVQSWKPKIDIDPEWKKVKLGEVCDVRDGTHDSPKQIQEGYPLITSKNIKDGHLDFSNIGYISEIDFKKVSQRSYVDTGDIIMPMIGTIGGACLIKSKEIEFAIKNVALFKKSEQIIPDYLLNILNSDLIATLFENQSAGATQKFVSLGVLRGIEIPLPPLETQKQIVEKIEAERSQVESAKKLIAIYEEKTKDTIAKIWGNDED